MPFLLSLLGPLLGKVIDTIGSKMGVDLSSDENKAKKMELELELQKLVAQQDLAVQAANLAQIQVNAEEAKNSNMFVSGWRPFIGWICGTALGYHFILQPLIAFTVASSGGHIELPMFDMQSLLTVLMGMLGLGAMRSYEKVYGVAREGMNPVGIAPNGPAVKQPKPGALVTNEEGDLVWKEY